MEEAKLCVALRERVEDVLQSLLESLPLEKLLSQQQLLEAGFGPAEGFGSGEAGEEEHEQDARSPYDEFSAPATPAPAPADGGSDERNVQMRAGDPQTPMYRPFAMT